MSDIFFIKSVHLTNFRNYKNISLDLGRMTTIIIGRNGAGKTNMITAIKQSLSFIFSKKKDAPQFDFVASSDQKVKSFLSTDPRYEDGDYKYPIAVGADVQLYNDKKLLSWELRKPSADRGINESYVTACVRFWTKVFNTNKIPVFTFFSDSYPHVQSTMGKNMQG
jgi:recF/recN/SMC N-terminal domain protein